MHPFVVTVLAYPDSGFHSGAATTSWQPRRTASALVPPRSASKRRAATSGNEAGWARIVLGGLPANYRLDLYSACGTRIASSNYTKKKFEETYLVNLWRPDLPTPAQKWSAA